MCLRGKPALRRASAVLHLLKRRRLRSLRLTLVARSLLADKWLTR